jgi:hypothetical protein
VGPRGAAYSCVRQDPEAPDVASPVEAASKAHEGRRREAASTACEERSGEAKTHESIGHPGLRFGGVRISAGSKALEPRGIMTYWSSEQ